MTFEPDDEEDILEELVQGAEVAFGQELDPDQASVIEEHYKSIADYFAFQQQAIQDVSDAAKLTTAEGDDLSARGALVGVPRREATSSETLLRFTSNPGVKTDRTIQEGTTVQTDSTDAIQFETDSDTVLEFLDGFDDGDISEYSGATGAFSLSSGTTFDGSHSLEADDNGTTGLILNDNITLEDESAVDIYLQAVGTASGAFIFGAQDTSNFYRAKFDAGSAEVSLEVVESGSVTNSVTDSGGIDNVTWHRMRVAWKRGTEIDITVTNLDTGNVSHSLSLDESSRTYSSGQIGFEDFVSDKSLYFDSVGMAATTVLATSVNTGSITNVSENTVTVFSDSVIGADEVTNLTAAIGGRDTEDDSVYRDRIQNELAEGSKATQPALIRALTDIESTRTVSVIVNDQDSTDSAGRPAYSFEAIVDVPSTDEQKVAQRIVDTKAGGGTSVGGYLGTEVTKTTDLPNGQTKDISFSVPAQTQIYYDVDIDTTSDYEGDDAVRDSIVQYTGGTSSDSGEISGELDVSEDVIYFQVAEAIMDVNGVQDISNLEIGTSSSPTGTGNVSINAGNTAYTDATDTSATSVDSTQV